MSHITKDQLAALLSEWVMARTNPEELAAKMPLGFNDPKADYEEILAITETLRAAFTGGILQNVLEWMNEPVDEFGKIEVTERDVQVAISGFVTGFNLGYVYREEVG